MPTLTVDLGPRSYDILIGSNLLGQAGEMIKSITPGRKILLVSNPTVYGLYGEICTQSLAKSGLEVACALMPDGEEYKNMQEVLGIVDEAVKGRVERSSLIMALGGGVVGDLAGFVAAIYQRGIDFVQIPTTLLAQVDSSVGGKVAVNHLQGKNLLGAFHQPRLVIIDSGVLKTLNRRDYLSAMGEIIKYGLIYDESFFTFLEAEVSNIMQQEENCLQKIIYRSCEIKSEIVAEDETEQGKRAILNLGHTFGHAVEKLGDYKIYRHGEAVAIGMATAAHLSVILGLMSSRDLRRVKNLLASFSLNIRFPDFDTDDVISVMQRDKKVKDNKMNFVLPCGIGNCAITDNITEKEIKTAIKEARK